MIVKPIASTVATFFRFLRADQVVVDDEFYEYLQSLHRQMLAFTLRRIDTEIETRDCIYRFSARAMRVQWVRLAEPGSWVLMRAHAQSQDVELFDGDD